jgi:hypothetical protein
VNGQTAGRDLRRHPHDLRDRAPRAHPSGNAAVVVTDGYIEPLGKKLLQRAAATRLHAIVTRDGHPAALARAGIPYTQLGRLPS